MKAVIFAGGVGTRLWPLSRKKSPKQFEKIIGDKSTLQLTVERILPAFDPKDIYISTGSQYVDLVASQLKMIPRANIIGEPAKRDVGPAVALAMAHVARANPDEPVIILWSDHLVHHEKRFLKIIKSAEEVVTQDKKKVVFIGQKPRFASENLGWIEFGESVLNKDKVQFHTFKNLKYKPSPETAQRYFKDSHHAWNLGYFVATPAFMLSLFEKFAPAIHELVTKIMKQPTEGDFQKALEKYYPQMPEVHFDNAILEQLDKTYAYVIVEDIGWSDVGAWEALKESLEKSMEENITRGKVLLEDSQDNLVYNYQENKLIVGIDLGDLLIVNTEDVLLVSKKTSVGKIKKLVESFQGTEHENLT